MTPSETEAEKPEPQPAPETPAEPPADAEPTATAEPPSQPPSPQHLAFWQLAVLLIVAAVVFWPGQMTVPPVDRDESRYAQAASQMLETGDFIDIRLQDSPRHLQPAGIYWLQAAAVAAISDVEAREIWLHRLPSYIAAIVVVLLTGILGARLFGRSVGFLGALLLASTVVLGVEARLAKTDAVLLLTIMVALLALHRAYQARHGAAPPGWGWAIAFWVAIGVGSMIKGPMNPLVVGLAAAMLCIFERRVRWLLGLKPLVGIAIALAIALPWYVAIYIESSGAFFQSSAGTNLLGKVFTGQQSHGFPPGYYILVANLTFWPASLALVLGLPWIWRHRREPAVRFCLAVILPTWVMFELIVTKLPHYTLPTYPALALLTAAAVSALDVPYRAAGRWQRVLFWPFLAAWVAIGLTLTVGPFLLVSIMDLQFLWIGLPVVALGIAVLALSVRSLLRAPPVRAFRYAPAITLAALWLNGQFVLPEVDSIWINRQVAEAAAELAPCPDYRVMTAPLDLESVVFLTRTDTVLEHPDQIAEALQAGVACAVLFLEAPQEAELRALLGDAPVDLVPADRTITGFNFSNGRWVDLNAFVVEPQAG